MNEQDPGQSSSKARDWKSLFFDKDRLPISSKKLWAGATATTLGVAIIAVLAAGPPENQTSTEEFQCGPDGVPSQIESKGVVCYSPGKALLFESTSEDGITVILENHGSEGTRVMYLNNNDSHEDELTYLPPGIKRIVLKDGRQIVVWDQEVPTDNSELNTWEYIGINDISDNMPTVDHPLA